MRNAARLASSMATATTIAFHRSRGCPRASGFGWRDVPLSSGRAWRAEGNEGDHAGEETVVVQGGAHEPRRERGEETEHGEPCEHPGAGHEPWPDRRGGTTRCWGRYGTNNRRLDGPQGAEAKPDDGEQGGGRRRPKGL
jgi:hypothetical protein